MDNAMPTADEIKALADLIETRLLRVRPDDQDLQLEDADWRLVIQSLRNQAADLIERLARAEPAVPVAGWVHLQYFLGAYDDEPDHRMIGAAIDREDDMLSFGDLRQVLSHPPRTPDVEAVARAISDWRIRKMYRPGVSPDDLAGFRAIEVEHLWKEEVELVEVAIAAMTGEAEHG